MTLYDLSFITVIILSLALLRFGLPILIMWALNQVLGLLAHPTSY